MIDDVDFSQFHTYSIVSKPGSVEWLIDGVSRMQAADKSVSAVPMYWIMNGWVGGWPGKASSKTPFPVSFEVDHFRVYRVDGVIGEPVIKILSSSEKTRSVNDAIEVALANFDEGCTHVEMLLGSESFVARSAKAPFRFPLTLVGPGEHTITFTATDGVRTTKTATTIEVTAQ
jgi:hypothetical protein